MKYIRTQQGGIASPFLALCSFISFHHRATYSLPCFSRYTSLLLLCIIVAPRAPRTSAVNLTVSRNYYIFFLPPFGNCRTIFLLLLFFFYLSSFSFWWLSSCSFYFILINGQRADAAHRGLDGMHIFLSVPHLTVGKETTNEIELDVMVKLAWTWSRRCETNKWMNERSKKERNM